MLGIVVDTSVMVAGLASRTGASRHLLLAALDGEVTMLLSTPLLFEYEAVLTRPALLTMAGLSTADVLFILDELVILCDPVMIDLRWRPQAHDPDDEMVLETAINGGADVVATFNVVDMRAGAARFGIQVERPGAVLERIQK